MSASTTYRHYFNIDPEYFPTVNEAVIKNNPEVWKKFFPHETFTRLIKNVVSVLERRQKASLWVEGAYGTGKSHAVLTLKRLLDANAEDTREYFEKYEEYGLDRDLRQKLQQIKDSGKILTVHRYGSSSIHGDNDLVLAVQESVERALTEAGIVNAGRESLRQAVIRYLSDSENAKSFDIYSQGSYRTLFGGDDAAAIVRKLKEYQGEALRELMEKVFTFARERGIRIFSMTVRDLNEWLTEVIKANELKAIVFIWDEFTEYFYNNSRNLTGFQELCELSATQPFYLILVTHVSEGLFREGDKDFTKLNDRFVRPHSIISLPENIAFQLMGAAMEKSPDEAVRAEWDEFADELASRTNEARRVVKGYARINDKDILGILPIHPYTALLLKHISAAFNSNQRSMFDFIKNDQGDEIKGFQWFIDNYGPTDDNPLLTVDMLWEFFYEKGRDHLAADIRTVLNYYSRSGKKLPGDQQCVLKTILLLQAISQHAGDAVDQFIPNEKNISYAFEGTDLEDSAANIAELLVRDKVLFKKQLGPSAFQYAAYTSEVNGPEIDKHKEAVDRKTTAALISEQINDGTTVADAVTLEGALKLRYQLYPAGSSDFDAKVRTARSRAAESEGTIAALVCFAKDDPESALLARKIREAATKEDNAALVFIDASLTPFGKDGYEQYREQTAQSMYQQNKDNALSRQYTDNAKEALKKWKSRIASGAFMVHTAKVFSGVRAATMGELFALLQKIDKDKYPCCLEAEYAVLPTMYQSNSLALGVECGALRKTRQVYSSGNVNTKLETALAGAWDEEKYWEKRPHLLISRIKIAVDTLIQKAFKEHGRISISEVYDRLKDAPFGFMPCNLTAFVLGFVLADYTKGDYTWSDDVNNKKLDLDKLKEMVSEIIKHQVTPIQRYKNKYIVALTKEEKAFNEATAYAFGLEPEQCTSVEKTRSLIREKMQSLSFPIWTIKSVLPEIPVRTERSVLETLLNDYCGIANSANLDKSKSDNDFAMEIGALCLKNPSAKDDLKKLLSKENCTAGMTAYVREFEGGELPKIATEIGDGGQYINVLRAKFNADAANWVWNIETADQKIRETVLDYRIISESNKVLSPNTTLDGTVSAWCEKCGHLRVSFAAVKSEVGDAVSLLEILHSMKKSGTLPDGQKTKFLDALRAHADTFNQFYNSQIDVFKRVCSVFLDGFSDEEIEALFKTLPTGVFTKDKSEYYNLVQSKADEYRQSLGNEQLKNLWKEKTGSESPRKWSQKHVMPLLYLIPDDEIQTARAAFDAVNQSHPNAKAIEAALAYLKSANFYDQMNDDAALRRVFREKGIKGYDVMLTDIDEVKNYLQKRISIDPYEWFGLPEVDTKLRQLAEVKYLSEGNKKALEKIDGMSAEQLKRYLKTLIKDNMIVGMEIIKETQGD